MKPDPIAEKAFDFAQDATKQMITLATGIIALTVTFIHDLAAHASATAILIVEAGWIVYVVSIFFGLMTLLQFAGNLETTERPSIYGGGIKYTSVAQTFCFLAGTALVIAFGVGAHHITPA
jgi:hypothetical protein